MRCRYVSRDNAHSSTADIDAGFSISATELAAKVKDYVTSSTATGWANLGAVIGALKNTDLRWASPLELKNAVEAAFTESFGTKEAAKPKGKV